MRMDHTHDLPLKNKCVRNLLIQTYMIGKGIKFQYLLQNCEINLFGYHGNHEKCKFSIEINGKSIFFNNGKSRW